MKGKGVVAAGHEASARAAEAVLREGGNAFDAVFAAFFAACVAEPVLASLGGGGFLLAKTARDPARLYDFFVHTPREKASAKDIDFYPIVADFGTQQQTFHIGWGSVATPGAARGVFEAHRELGTMPMRDIVTPALTLAREGVKLNALQAMISGIVAPILRAGPEVAALFSEASGEGLLPEGGVFTNPAFADALEALAIEGDALFYRGEIGQALVRCCREHGGYLSQADLDNYRVIRREPLRIDYRGTRLTTNPPAASGGILIAFALKLLEPLDLAEYSFGGAAFLDLLARVMAQTNRARLEAGEGVGLLDESFLGRYREAVLGRPAALRGTTHFSVMDAAGNIAAMSVSNGEGCGALIPGTGIMPNNMLGEEDLNPQGFHQWQGDTRMTSMMAPGIVQFSDGREAALGSGGSNRIRTAMLQVLLNLIDFDMDVATAVHHPRVHFEADLLSVEGGHDPDTVAQLVAGFPRHHVWDARNLFFGGVHTVMRDTQGFSGAGDPRRGGVCRVIV